MKDTITPVLDIIEKASENGIRLFLEEGKLKFKVAKKTKPNPSVLAEIKENKEAIIDFLSSEAGNFKIITADNEIIVPFDRNTTKRIPLSYAQERLWFIDHLEGSTAYHIPAVLQLKGKLNTVVLSDSFREIVNRHEVLRSVLKSDGGQAYQEVLPKNLWNIDIDKDIQTNDESARKAKISNYINAPFNMTKDHMLRALLLPVSEEEHILVIVMHHIASDGWSLAVLVQELKEIYQAKFTNSTHNLEKLPIQYADFAFWQRENISKKVLNQKLKYWEEQLNGVTPLALPTDFSRPAIQSSKGNSLHKQLNLQLTNNLKSFSQQEGGTLFMTLIAAFKVLMHRYSGQADICVGSPIANRTKKELESLVGFFVNTLALRSHVDGNESFLNLFEQVKKHTLDAYSHQEVPFEKIVDKVEPERDPGRSPVFQVMFILQNNTQSSIEKLGDIEVTPLPFEQKSSKLDLAFNLKESEEGLILGVEYCSDLFQKETILSMMDHFENLLEDISKNPAVSVKDLNFLSKTEQLQLGSSLNHALQFQDNKETIISLFEDQVTQNPDAVALVFEEEEISYNELNKRANQLANYLKNIGVQKESFVGLLLEKSPEMIVGLLGILKAGGAYIPIDTDYPAERINFMLEDTDCHVIVSHSKCLSSIHNYEKLKTVLVDLDKPEISKQSKENLPLDYTENQLAYILYTSGTTGKPKGGLIEHRGVVNLILAHQEILQIQAGTGFLQFASIGFDGAIFEIYNTLLNGGKLVLSNKENLTNPESLQALIQKHDIKIACIPPSLQGTMKDHLHGLEILVSGGEALKKEVVKELPNSIKVLNSYGPTENTCCITLSENPVTDDDKVTIGKPIANVSVCILDSYQQMVPQGIIGELYVGGQQLSRGYHNRPELNKEKFQNIEINNFEKKRLYKTGDLARWMPDGNIEFIGRIDDQVKLRGHRIELEEINNVLIQHQAIKGAISLIKESTKNKQLVAYIISEGEIAVDEIQGFLKLQLPAYMIPSLILRVDSFPLTPNGKVDKKILLELESEKAITKNHVSPRNDKEEVLTQIWQELLNKEDISIYDNFFELGGDSIITIQVVSRVKNAGYHMKARDIFQHQTVAALALIMTSEKENYKTEQGLLQDEAPLLPIQKWFLEKEFTGLSHFNQAVLLQIDKEISLDHVKQTFKELVAHHDALRFNYSKEKNAWSQQYGKAEGKVDLLDFSSIQDQPLKEMITEACQSAQESLDIENGELIKTLFIKTPEVEDQNRLFIAIHHLAVDGVSWRILLEQIEFCLSTLSNNKKIDLGEKSSSYRQWALALEKYAFTEKIKAQQLYWEEMFHDVQPLAADFDEEKTLAKEVKKYTVSLDSKLTHSLLQKVNQAYNTEINDILLAALGLTISQFNGHEKVLIGLEGHGREAINKQLDLSRTVGWFTNMYPVALNIKPDYDEAGIVKSVKEQIRQIPEKGMGYGLLRYLHPDNQVRATFSIHQWEILFNYLGQFDNAMSADKGLQVAEENIGESISPYCPFDHKLEINSSISDGQLRLAWSYSTKQYKTETIQKLADTFIDNITQLILHCKSQKGKTLTPADYGLGAEISFNELDQFLKSKEKGVERKQLIESIYGLSPLQEGMLFHSLYEQNTTAYVEQFIFDFPEGLNIEAFTQAWENILKNHSILRTAFFHEDFKSPVQVVFKNPDLQIETLDFTSFSDEEKQEKTEAFITENKQKGFDLQHPTLMRISFIRLEENHYKMVWLSHHLIMDGWSLPVLVDELLNNYEALIQGKNGLKKINDNYQDFIKYIKNKDPFEAKHFWRNYMRGFESASLLPFTDKSSTGNHSESRYQELKLEIDSVFTDQLKAYAQKNHLTVNTILQGSWAYLLSQYTGNKDVTYGVTVSGRPTDLENAEQKIGLFINTIPLHTYIETDVSIAEWLKELQEGQTKAREYQHTGLNEIQQLIQVKGELFDSLLVFENYPVGEVLSKDWALKIGNVAIEEQTNYPLTLVAGLGEKLSIKFSFNHQLLPSSYVELIKDQFEGLLSQIIKNDNVSELNLITEFEKQKILNSCNQTQTDWPKEETIVSLFELQAAQTPYAIATTFNGRNLSYQELNSKANQWSQHLINKGVKPDTLVGICLERSEEMIIGILATLKAGGAYVPIDPDYPQDRINYTLDDAGVEILLTSQLYNESFETNDQISVINLNQTDLVAKESILNPKVNVTAHNLAYVIYTSGTTGKPKGVLLEHNNVVRLFKNENQLFDFGSQDVWTMFHSFCFDFSVWEMYGAILFGGRLVIVPKEITKDIPAFKQLLSEEQVTILNQTPSAFYMLQEQILATGNQIPLRYVIFGGEKLNPAYLQKWIKSIPDCKLINMYGITETTVHVTYKEITEKDTSKSISNIGVPIPTLSCFILDENHQMVPTGVSGELFVGGAGVARGYLNRVELTEQRFVSLTIEGKTERYYKTGDVGRWLPNGELEYLGRSDDQVKIRGFRIELGEIENVLKQVTGVKQCVVLAKNTNTEEENEKILVAWLSIEDHYDKETTLKELKAQLPDYMIPTFLVEVDHIPLTSNGKVDKKALPDPLENIHHPKDIVAAQNEIEAWLIKDWEQLLKISPIGTQDDFFDLGGHSLLATRAISSIRKNYKVDLAIKDLFTHSTIAAISNLINNSKSEIVLPEITKQQRPERIPLSFAQERIWLIDQIEGSTHYHIPSVLKLNGKLDKNALEDAFQEIIKRHEVLRTTLKEEDSILFQEIREAKEWQLDFSNHAEDITEDAIHEEVHKPFDLTSDIMLRAKLCQQNEEEHILILVMHHIASDGWSLNILINELVELYLAKTNNKTSTLTPLKIQYADYALWQQKYLKGDAMDSKLAYWKTKLKGTSTLELPNDKGQIASTNEEGDAIKFGLDTGDSENLKHIAKKENATLFMVLLSAFKILLHKYSGQDDICIGTPIANRTQKECEPLIGFFLNTLAIRNEVSENMNFTELLSQVKTTTLEAYSHQDIPFEKVLEAVNPERVADKTPLFQVFFNLQNQPKDVHDLDGLTIQQVPNKVAASKFDITLYISENDKAISGLFVYNNQLFSTQRMNQMVSDFTQLIKAIIENPDTAISQLHFFTDNELEEQEQELMDFFEDF